jgi:hypothetical protein
MKKSLFVILTIAALTILMTSCTKEEINNEINSTEEMTLIEDVMNGIEETIDEATFGLTQEAELESRFDPCVEITSTAPLGTFPNTFTFDFGDGCEGPHGKVRKGVLTITLTDHMENEDAVRTLSFVDFYVDEVQLVGSRITSNTGLNDAGKQTFLREMTGIQFIFPNGEIATRDASHELTFLEGYETHYRLDNIVAITGNATGTSRNGVTYTSTIIEPLIKRGDCRWITRGTKEITRDDKTIMLDYGDGACNRVAVVTFEDGSTKEINLHRKWW